MNMKTAAINLFITTSLSTVKYIQQYVLNYKRTIFSLKELFPIHIL